jgi:hypothetical protein
VAPAQPERAQAGHRAADVAVQVVPPVLLLLVAEPPVQLDDQPQAEVLDVAVGPCPTHPDLSLPLAGRQAMGTLDPREVTVLQQ